MRAHWSIEDLAAAPDPEARVARCRDLMAQRPDDYFYQAAGLRELVAMLGKAADTEVQAALSSPNEVLREAARSLDTTQGE